MTIVLPLLDGCETMYAAKVFTLKDQAGLKVCYGVLEALSCVTMATLSLRAWMQGLLERANAAGLEVVGNTAGPERVLLYLEDLEDGQVRRELHVSAYCSTWSHTGAAGLWTW